MEYSYNNNGNDRLLIFFLGWSCDSSSVSHLGFENYDTLYVFDYRQMRLDIDNIISVYSKRYLLGWSFGVWAAALWARNRNDISASIAICGTPCPIDDKYGIPDKIFNFTLRSIKSKGIEQFNIRMCGDSIANFRPSQRAFDGQYHELEVLGKMSQEHQNLDFYWDHVLVGEKDLIFPLQNSVNYWNKNSKFAVKMIDTPHYPFTEVGLKELHELLRSV